MWGFRFILFQLHLQYANLIKSRNVAGVGQSGNGTSLPSSFRRIAFAGRLQSNRSRLRMESPRISYGTTLLPCIRGQQIAWRRRLVKLTLRANWMRLTKANTSVQTSVAIQTNLL